MVAVTVPTVGLDLRSIEGMDPTSSLVEVRGQGIDTAELAVVAALNWAAAVARVRVALAHELVGVARQMLELARTHALERIQFGVPISSFQAVRHRLAETLVAVETAEALIDAAWLETDRHRDHGQGDGGARLAPCPGHCQQVLAGIGFTTEHDFQRYFRRVRVLDGLFGSSTSLTRSLGDELIASRQLPPLLPL